MHEQCCEYTSARCAIRTDYFFRYDLEMSIPSPDDNVHQNPSSRSSDPLSDTSSLTLASVAGPIKGSNERTRTFPDTAWDSSSYDYPLLNSGHSNPGFDSSTLPWWMPDAVDLARSLDPFQFCWDTSMSQPTPTMWDNSLVTSIASQPLGIVSGRPVSVNHGQAVEQSSSHLPSATDIYNPIIPQESSVATSLLSSTGHADLSIQSSLQHTVEVEPSHLRLENVHDPLIDDPSSSLNLSSQDSLTVHPANATQTWNLPNLANGDNMAPDSLRREWDESTMRLFGLRADVLYVR
jgi:hypothetical protein